MKTFNSLKMFAIAFVAIFLSASFFTAAQAQCKDSYDAFTDELDSPAIISIGANVDDSVYEIEMIVNEQVVDIASLGFVIDLLKIQIADNELDIPYDVLESASSFEEADAIFNCTIKGNMTGMIIEEKLTPCEMLMLGMILDNYDEEETSIDDLSMEEVANEMNKTFIEEDAGIRLELNGNKLVIVTDVSEDVFYEMAEFAECAPELFAETVSESFLEGFSPSSDFLEFVKQKGYSLSYSIVCGYNEPITIDLDMR